MNGKSFWKSHHRSLILISALVLIPLVISFINIRPEQEKHSPPVTTNTTTNTPVTIIKAKNVALQQTLTAYHQAPPEKKQALLEKLESTAKERKGHVLRLMRENPQDVEEVVFSTRYDLPPQVQLDVEEVTTVQGNLKFFLGENFKEKKVIYSYLLTSPDNKSFDVTFAADNKNKPTDLQLKPKVIINGIMLENKVVVGKNTTDLQILSQPSPKVLGTKSTKKIAVVLFNWSNYKDTPFTLEEAKNMVSTGPRSSNAYFEEVSFGQFHLEGKKSTTAEVVGWYTIPDSIPKYKVDYGDYGEFGVDGDCTGTVLHDWTAKAEEAAKRELGDLNGYDRIIYGTPKIFCNGVAGVTDGISIWAFGSDFNSHTVSHEIGHTVNAIDHATVYDCIDASGNRVSISNNCKSEQYSDPFDIMGVNGGLPHLHNHHKEKAGWFNPENIQTITASGKYTLIPQEQKSTGVQVLKIPIADGHYYLEFRQPFGFDQMDQFREFGVGSNVPQNIQFNVFNGITIRIGLTKVCPDSENGCDSILIDANPQTTGFFDAALILNQTFTDSQKKISIKTVNVSPTGAEVYVSLNGDPVPTDHPTVAPTDPVPTFVCAGSTNSVCVTPSLQPTSPPSNTVPTIVQPTANDEVAINLPTGIINPGNPGANSLPKENGLISTFIGLLIGLLLLFLGMLF